MKAIITLSLSTVLLLGCLNSNSQSRKQNSSANFHAVHTVADTTHKFKVHKSEEEWKSILTNSEYRILRDRGTELPYVNKYYDQETQGVYYCGACGQPVFTSKTKYESGTGWPSFWKPIKSTAIGTQPDEGFFTTRTEVICSRCGSHLGHVFEDGPEPTGLRYCLNSAALDFKNMDLSEVDIKNLKPLPGFAANQK